MTPVDVPVVSVMNVWSYITIGIAGLAGLCFLLAIIDKAGEVYSNAKGNPVISTTWWTLTKTTFALLLLSVLLYAIAAFVYGGEVKAAAASAVQQLEQETGVTILDKDSIEYVGLDQETSAIEVSFKHEESIYDGAIIVEDGGMLLHVKETGGEGQRLTVFNG